MSINKRLNKLRQHLQRKEKRVYLLDKLNSDIYLDVKANKTYNDLSQLEDAKIIIIDDIE